MKKIELLSHRPMLSFPMEKSCWADSIRPQLLCCSWNLHERRPEKSWSRTVQHRSKPESGFTLSLTTYSRWIGFSRFWRRARLSSNPRATIHVDVSTAQYPVIPRIQQNVTVSFNLYWWSICVSMLSPLIASRSARNCRGKDADFETGDGSHSGAIDSRVNGQIFLCLVVSNHQR
jgi:hypothetical protein